jgi:hypothetical protein
MRLLVKPGDGCGWFIHNGHALGSFVRGNGDPTALLCAF